jgi:hypothetical protein
MARVHFWQFLLNEEGIPIPAADIYVYLANTLSPAYVYTSESGGTATITTPQVTTTADGFFEFWIGDSEESAGYSVPQKFKIVWEKTGVAEGYIDNLDILPNAPRYFNDTITTWTSAATGYYYDLTHGLNNSYPLVRVWNTTTQQVIDPWKIESLTAQSTRVWMLTETNIEAVVIG